MKCVCDQLRNKFSLCHHSAPLNLSQLFPPRKMFNFLPINALQDQVNPSRHRKRNQSGACQL